MKKIVSRYLPLLSFFPSSLQHPITDPARGTRRTSNHTQEMQKSQFLSLSVCAVSKSLALGSRNGYTTKATLRDWHLVWKVSTKTTIIFHNKPCWHGYSQIVSKHSKDGNYSKVWQESLQTLVDKWDSIIQIGHHVMCAQYLCFLC